MVLASPRAISGRLYRLALLLQIHLAPDLPMLVEVVNRAILPGYSNDVKLSTNTRNYTRTGTGSFRIRSCLPFLCGTAGSGSYVHLSSSPYRLLLMVKTH